ncbi:MAG: hypothetical protein KatS3mg101_0193 [Patescibacteria group bacterium]|nr:MAG: hypothetical protein KatS3mg101_0193 [Patescibacteria group bacterium]
MRRNPPETLRKFEEDRIREQFEKDLEKIQKHRENTYKEWLKDTSSTITTLKPKKEATNWMLERELYEIDLEEKMRQDREDKDEGAD